MMTKHNSLNKFFMILLGVTFLLCYIWFRFLRTRLPRTLPFTLLVITFFFLIFSMILYLYLILRLFKPVSNDNKIIRELSNLVYSPLEELDSFLKLYLSFDNVLFYLSERIKTLDKVYFYTNILPRIITSSALIIDVFIFFKLQYIYTVICITIIPLITRYFVYSLKKHLEENINILAQQFAFISMDYVYGVHPDEWPENQIEDTDDNDDFIGAHTDVMHLPLKIFIPYQTQCIVYNNQTPSYSIFLGGDFYARYKKENTIEKKKRDLRNAIEKLLKVSIFLVKYKRVDSENKLLRNLKAFVYGIYIGCWSYIIFFTAPKVLWFTGLISLSHTLYIMEDPFSGSFMLPEIYDYATMFL